MEANKMSRTKAVGILMDMMRDETLGVDSIKAIGVGINEIMHRYRARMMYQARVYERAAAGEDVIRREDTTETVGSEVAE